MTKTEREKRLTKIAEKLWKKSEPAEVERPARRDSTVLSVRMPRETLRYLTEFAREQGKGPATLARELIEQGLALESTPSSYVAARVLGRLLEVQQKGLPLWEGPGEKLVIGLQSYCSAAGVAFRELAGPETAAELFLWPRTGLTIQRTPVSRQSEVLCMFSLSSPSAAHPSSGSWRYASLATLTSPAGEEVCR